MNKKILRLVKERLLVGEKKYGNENVISDGRDFIKEALEESLDLAVYVSAKLIEIKQKEKQMGRAIEQDNRLDGHDREFEKMNKRIKLMEDALEEMIQTKVHHVDLVEDVAPTKIEGSVLEPDEEYTAPVGKRKKTKKTKTAPVG